MRSENQVPFICLATSVCMLAASGASRQCEAANHSSCLCCTILQVWSVCFLCVQPNGHVCATVGLAEKDWLVAQVVQEIKVMRSGVTAREKERAERATLVQQEKLSKAKVLRALLSSLHMYCRACAY